jgi:hypothetical protein
MRRRFDVQLALGQTPIERVQIPVKSRDELPPILAGLQWIFQTPEINEQVFALLESKVVAGKKATGRPGLDLWQILVLGVVRLGLDCDYDRLEDLANHHTLLRQMLGVFHELLIKQLDLVERRWLREEKIPHAEKIFSLFEPHTEFIKKGKLFPPVELGHKLLLTTDQHELIVDYRVMDQQPNERDESIGVADRLTGRYGTGNILSLSFDKGFTREEDRQLLELYIPEVIMPKRGRRSQREQEREQARSFQALRRRHQAIESDINALEHHGLNRCLDKGLSGYKRYVGLGVLAYNLHKIGKQLLDKKRAEALEQSVCA